MDEETQLTAQQMEQIELEHETAAACVNKYWERKAKLVDKGMETLSKPVRHVLAGYIDPLATGIKESFAEAQQKPGRKSTAIRLIYWAHPEVLALQALRSVMDSISRPRRFQTVAMRIARDIESELRYQAFEQQNEGLYRSVQKHIKESPFGFRPSYRQKVMVHAFNRYDIMWDKWTIDELYAVGVWMLDCVIRHTGLVEEYRYSTRGGTNTTLKVVPTAALTEWLNKQHATCAEMQPRMLPMLCPPKPWTTPRDGGYLTDRYRTSLVPTKSRTFRADYSKDAMPLVYEAVNWLQDTPWRVNRFVLDTLSYFWDNDFDLPQLTRSDVPIPPKPPAGATKLEIIEAKMKRREVRLENEGMTGRRIAMTHTLSIAKRFADRSIWFPHRLDFRGRLYPLPQYLEPQGNDVAKGLLEFADGEPITPDGMRWLKIHAANSYGVDKGDVAERIAWVDENWEMVESIAADPIEDRRWMEADGGGSSTQFLAACDALVRAAAGEPVHLPVGVDGSCNGIQHLAAMSRDKEAGRLVNLVPGPKPGDIYSVVAVNVIDIVREKIKNPRAKLTSKDKVLWTADEEKLMGQLWLEFEITRTLTKRPTMILPYNGTMSAVEKYIDEHVGKTIRKTGIDPFGTRRLKAVKWLAMVVGPAMRKVVKGPVHVMEWTKKLAQATNGSREPLVWTTPSGFTVVQAYNETRSRRVQTRVGDRVYKLALSEHIDRLDIDQQRRSFAPNWIHSYDAASLVLTLFAASLLGLRMAAVHDSYLTHPNRMTELSRVLREEFVRMYANHNRMEQLRTDVARYTAVDLADLPEPPELGELDVALVMDSPFFFL